MEQQSKKYKATVELTLPLDFAFLFLDWHVAVVTIPQKTELDVSFDVGNAGSKHESMYAMIMYNKCTKLCLQSSIAELIKNGSIIEITSQKNRE